MCCKSIVKVNTKKKKWVSEEKYGKTLKERRRRDKIDQREMETLGMLKEDICVGSKRTTAKPATGSCLCVPVTTTSLFALSSSALEHMDG
jgi:hypothetical protein